MLAINDRQLIHLESSSSTATLDYLMSVDNNSTDFNLTGYISSTTPKILIPSWGTNVQRGSVYYLSVSNTHASASANLTISLLRGTLLYVLFKCTLAAGERVIYDGNNWTTYDSTGRIRVTVPVISGGGGSADGGNVIAAGTQTADSTGTVIFQDGNGITFGMDSNTVTASYTVPATTHLQQTSLMSNYLGTSYTSHTHSQYVNTSQSSLFQATSLMSNYLGTTYTSHTHSEYVNTSQSSLFQQTSLMSDYLGTAYTTHTHTQSNQAVSGSNGSSTFQTLSMGNSNGLTFYLTNGSVVGSYTVPSVTEYQHSSLMSDYLGTTYTTHTHSQYLTTQSVQTQNMVSVQGSTGNIYFENGNGITFGGNASTITASYTVPSVTQYQHTSLMSDYLGTGYTTHTHSQYINTSQSSLFQQTSLMSNYLGTNYTTHTHSQSVQPVAASAQNGSFNFSTLRFVDTNGVSFATSTDGIRASVNTAYLALSNSSLLQHTSLMSNYLGTNYTTHTHAAQPVAVSGSNGSFNFSTLSFGNLNGMSFYTSNGSIVASYTDGGGAGGGIALANSQTTFSASTVNLSAAGALTIASTTGQSFQFSVPNTSSLSAEGQLTISVTSNTIKLGVPNALTLSYFNPQDGYLQVAGQQGNASMHFQPMQAPNVQFDRIAIPMNFTNATNTTGSATLSMSIGFFTNNASTLSLVSSTSYSAAITYSGTVNNSSYAGIKLHTIPFTGTFLEGQYYVGIWSRTTSGGANGTLNQVLASQMNSNFNGVFGAGTNATNQYTRGLGHYSVTFSTAMPNAVPFTDIRGTASIVLRQPLFYLVSGTV